MKNDECTIYFTVAGGWTQTVNKKNGIWIQTTNGVKRKMTAEQLLNHILPVLAGKKGVSVKVKKKVKK